MSSIETYPEITETKLEDWDLKILPYIYSKGKSEHNNERNGRYTKEPNGTSRHENHKN